MLRLPPGPKVDRRRAGVMLLSTHLLGELLRLPDGLHLASVRMRRDGDSLALVIEGEPMPPRPRAGAATPVLLMCSVEQDDAVRRVFAWFEHAPERRWLLREEPVRRPENALG